MSNEKCTAVIITAELFYCRQLKSNDQPIYLVFCKK